MKLHFDEFADVQALQVNSNYMMYASIVGINRVDLLDLEFTFVNLVVYCFNTSSYSSVTITVMSIGCLEAIIN